MTKELNSDERAGQGTQSVREGLIYCAKVFLAVRIALFLLAFVGVSAFTSRVSYPVLDWPARPIPDPGWHAIFTAWERFDALWFLQIATHGYGVADRTAVFFPFYPLTVRAVSYSIGWHPFAAALIVSNASFLGALFVLYSLTASEFSDRVARRTVLYISIFPTSVFFFAPYSESIFLLFVVTSFWGARRGRWPVAGAAGVLAALTRGSGLLLFPALVVEAVQQRFEGRDRLWSRLGWSACVPIGTALYLGYWWVRAGNWSIPLQQQASWGRTASPPWTGLIQGAQKAFAYPGLFPSGDLVIDLLIVLTAMIAAVFAVRWFRASYSVWTWGGLLFALTYTIDFSFNGRPLASIPRYVLPLFPIFWVAALAAERRISHDAIVIGSSIGLAVCTILFVNWGMA